jgi:predicted transcriptional regulator
MAKTQMSIYVTEEIAQRLRKLAEEMGAPVGRHTGDMLEALIESAQFITDRMVEAKTEPALAMRKLKAMDKKMATIAKHVHEA